MFSRRLTSTENLKPDVKSIVKEYAKGKHTIAGKKLIDLIDNNQPLALNGNNKLPPARGFSVLFDLPSKEEAKKRTTVEELDIDREIEEKEEELTTESH